MDFIVIVQVHHKTNDKKSLYSYIFVTVTFSVYFIFYIFIQLKQIIINVVVMRLNNGYYLTVIMLCITFKPNKICLFVIITYFY